MQKPVSILLVEDSPSEVFIIRDVLSEQLFPITLRVAVDGDQAIRILSNSANSDEKPDLIILDLNLPKVNGLSVLERCRPDVPVVMFSSSASSCERQRALELGAKEFVQKPMDYDQYRHLVSQMVQNWAFRGGNAAAGA